MVQTGFVSETTSIPIVVLWRSAAPRKTDPGLLEDWDCIGQYRVARIGETGCTGDPVLRAPAVDDFQLFTKIADIFLGDTGVISRVVTNLKPVAVQFCYLVPRHVI